MLTQSGGAKNEKTQTTPEQRLAALEATVTGLSEQIGRLHQMLKDQGERINEHTAKGLAAGSASADRVGGLAPEDVLFTFVCRRKFDHFEKELGKLRQLLIGPESIRRAS